MTSKVEKPGDELAKWCRKGGEAITLDILIGDKEYLGKGFAHILIQEFLQCHFPHVSEVIIDPEATNTRAIHVYQKAGFEFITEFIPEHSPKSHYLMRFSLP